MEKKWFVALLMVVVMMCACWTGAVADEERKTFTSGDYQYACVCFVEQESASAGV